MSVGGKETEIKLAVRDLTAVRRQLRRLGWRVRVPRSFEQNTLFDTPRSDLRRRGALLRLRSVAGLHRLTFKGPAGRSAHFKIRQEWETSVDDPAGARRLLIGLGFAPRFRYEKFRTEFVPRAGQQRGCVMLDETPIGDFLELEGSQGWIRGVARELGAAPRDFIARDYTQLYLDWCRRRGRRPTHMVFPSPRRPRR